MTLTPPPATSTAHSAASNRRGAALLALFAGLLAASVTFAAPAAPAPKPAAAPLDTIGDSIQRAAGAAQVDPIRPGPFKASCESLKNYQCPDWFRDAQGLQVHFPAQAPCEHAYVLKIIRQP